MATPNHSLRRCPCKSAREKSSNQRAGGEARMHPLHPVYFQEGRLYLLDQRLLPRRGARTSPTTTPAEVAEAIRDMVVRGAPAIGIAAAFGMALAAREPRARRPTGARPQLDEAARALRGRAPDRGQPRSGRSSACSGRSPAHLDGERASPSAAPREAQAHPRRGRGRAAAPWASSAPSSSPTARRVLTHCNAGALATGGYGTALGVIRAARRGRQAHAASSPTRRGPPAGRAAHRLGAAARRHRRRR